MTPTALAAAPLVDGPIVPAAGHPVNQLRDPVVYVEDGERHLVYAVAGESGLAVARLEARRS